jgi:hypothetical protein
MERRVLHGEMKTKDADKVQLFVGKGEDKVHLWREAH